ncbi:MAG: metallophosphoesterase [Chlamydiia bacterium]|nr:metallophosphoesterase [Chlamydiia bacterium]
MRIAHLSDLHFAKPSFGLGQFFSKRWLGNLNTLTRRGKAYCNERPFKLIPYLKELGVQMCLITGDFTSTANEQEFALSKKFTQALDNAHIAWFAIPGNHDCYTAQNMREKTFYKSFPDQFKTSAFRLSDARVTDGPLCEGWWLLALDTTLATPLISSEGHFPESLEKQLPSILANIPKGQKVLMINHFPFFQHERKKRRMQRGFHLQKLLEDSPSVQLYLHGHTHRLCLADLRNSRLPIILDSGSAAHHMLSSFNLIDLHPNTCDVNVYHWNDTGWHCIQKETFSWPNGMKKD